MARDFIVPGQIVSGSGALELAEKKFGSNGKKSTACDRQCHGRSWKLCKSRDCHEKQGIEYVIFSGVTGEPTDTMIEAGLKMYKDEECDFLVALGGGSPIDSMKAIGMMAAGGGNISDYMGKVIDVKMPPMAAIRRLQVPVPRLLNLRLSRIRREILKCF